MAALIGADNLSPETFWDPAIGEGHRRLYSALLVRRNPRPEGIKAPAIRMKRTANYRPHQLALFVFPGAPAAVHVPYENRSRLIMQCELQLRFLELISRRAVTIQTVDIDWCKPQFRIRGAGVALSRTSTKSNLIQSKHMV